jgi:2'-5' RNA ligase
MRLFVALDIPDETRAAVGKLIAQLAPLCRGAKWVRVEGIHLTLKFIGEQPEERVARLEKELGAVHSPDPVQLRFASAGFFPSARSPRVFWAGIEASPNLATLAEEIDLRLEPLGIPRERRGFKPHLTLARFNSAAGLPQLRDALAELGPLEFGRATASEFHLYRSQLQRGGAVYTRLATFPFVVASA